MAQSYILDRCRNMTNADCGAGVGRVTEQLLLHHFATVDLIEPSKHLIGTAEQNLSSPERRKYPAGHQAGQFFNMGLQAWTPEAGRYPSGHGMCHPASVGAAHDGLITCTQFVYNTPKKSRCTPPHTSFCCFPRGVRSCRYDVIWMQWALLYLTDGEIIHCNHWAALSLVLKSC